MNRRHFLMSTAALAASKTMFGSPSDRVRVAVIGCGGRGMSHVNAWTSLPNVELAAICDVDDSHVANYLKRIQEKATKSGVAIKAPATFRDMRKILDDKSIDAISIATPNHWHTLQTIWGCQAGKDVYVEKPCSHNVFESQQIVAAARKYNRLVQMGSQSRSSSALQEGVQKMREGLIGDVYMARALCFKWRDTIGRATPEAVPAGVDYDLWTGPSPMHKFTQNRFHYKWHWFWDTGNGDLGNQGIHEMDIARWGLGVKYPTKVSAIGGRSTSPEGPCSSYRSHHLYPVFRLILNLRHSAANDSSRRPARGSHSWPARGQCGELYHGGPGPTPRARSARPSG